MSVFSRRGALPFVTALIGLLPVAGFAQSGDLGLGVSYSDRYGATGAVGIELVELLDGALDAGLHYRAGEKGQEATANLGYRYQLGSTALGDETVARFRLSGIVSEWDVNPYETRALDLLVGIGAAINPRTRWSLNLVHNASDLTSRRDVVAASLVQDLGSSAATWVEAGLDYTTSPDAGLFDPAFRISGVIASTVSGDSGRNWHSAALSGEVVAPVGATMAAAFSLEGRVIAPQSGSDRVHVIDRYFANGRKPRGFAWGSAGPIDPVSADALGGTRQIAASAELRAPLPRDGLSAAVFVDAGSVWDLSGDATPGLDDDYALRSSAGLALRLSTRIGQFEAAIARPVAEQDRDIKQPFSVQFVTQF